MTHGVNERGKRSRQISEKRQKEQYHDGLNDCTFKKFQIPRRPVPDPKKRHINDAAEHAAAFTFIAVR